MLFIFESLFVFLLAVFLPAISILSYGKIKPLLLQPNPGIRIRLYSHSLLMHWILMVCVFIFWFIGGRSISDLGYALTFNSFFLYSFAVMMFFLIYQFGRIFLVRISETKKKKYFNNLDSMPGVEITPTTRPELNFFMIVSLSAGICEETVYRGYLIYYLSGFLNTSTAVLISTLIFAMGHGVQGVKGVLFTGLAGLVMAIIFVLTESLLIPIIFHSLINITTALFVWELRKLPGENN